jgi:hypothetical protein
MNDRNQRSNLSGKLGAAAANPVVTAVVGAAVGFLFCWWFLAMPLRTSLAAREEALQEWERINRLERAAVADMKTISGEELRKWVATIDDQNTRYAEMTRRLHQQEIALSGPGTTYLVLAVISLLGTAGFIAWMVRDGNANAAVTLNNAVAVLPALSAGLEQRIQADSITRTLPNSDSE